MKYLAPRAMKVCETTSAAASSSASIKPKVRLIALECEECRKVFDSLSTAVADLNLTWMNRDEMLEISNCEQHQKCVFIISSELFLDQTFMNSFADDKRRIYGASVLNYCFETNTPLPKTPLRLYSMSMFGVRISLSGFEPAIRDREVRRIELMGGIVDRDFSMSTSDILVVKASPVMSSKYKAAIHWRKPICDIRLINSMWECRDKNIRDIVTAEKNPFSLPIFAGCTICLSNFGLNERTAMGQTIEENGGVYALDMVQGVCTHLILNSGVGNKYKTAKVWGNIKIVTSRWLDKCVEKGCLLPEDLYYYDAVMKAQKRKATK